MVDDYIKELLRALNIAIVSLSDEEDINDHGGPNKAMRIKRMAKNLRDEIEYLFDE